MPFPILPVGQSESYNNFFEGTTLQSNQKTTQEEMQVYAKHFASEKRNESHIDLLELIDKNEDSFINTASSYMNGSGDYRTIPNSITDNQILQLKTSGLLNGYGRSVTLTEKGKNLLRSRYLNSENAFKSKRVQK